MIVRIKGEWGSVGHNAWLKKILGAWLYNRVSWRNVGKFSHTEELDIDGGFDWNATPDWRLRLVIEREIATLEVLFKDSVIGSKNVKLNDGEIPFSFSFAGQSVRGNIELDF
jgi:hypothetical protein